MQALRRHAIAIGMLIDDLAPEDLQIHKPGDVVQILAGNEHAGALLRVTEVLSGDRLRGYLLAASYRYRAGMRLSEIPGGCVRKVGNAPEAIGTDAYPLCEERPLSFEQASEAARLGWVAADEENRARRAAAARTKRKEKPRFPE